MSTIRPTIEAFVDEGLGNSSYLVNLGDGQALVIDPVRDPSRYLAAAERLGVSISHSAETHLHADFVTGSRELAARGATVLAPAMAGIEWPHRGVGDGEEIDLGGMQLRALATPGHTPEHVAYLLLDGSTPLVLFSGGSLLVDSVARTDLIASDRTEELARCLWRSLQERVLVLPDEVIVYPTHGAGSFCSAPSEADRVTTIGRERASNPLLGVADEDAFVTLLLSGLGSYPRYFLRLRQVNRRGPRVWDRGHPALRPLGVEEVRQLVSDGAELVDARPIDAFAQGHIAGALSIELRDAFPTWLGWLVPEDRGVVFVIGEDQDQAQLVRECLKVGYENLVGYLAGGMAAWSSAGLPVRQIHVVQPGQVRAGDLVDVRQLAEYSSGHLPGALHVELGSLSNASSCLPDRPLIVMCGHGERAMTGASLLERQGRHELAVLLGGPDDWVKATGGQLVVGTWSDRPT